MYSFTNHALWWKHCEDKTVLWREPHKSKLLFIIKVNTNKSWCFTAHFSYFSNEPILSLSGIWVYFGSVFTPFISHPAHNSIWTNLGAAWRPSCWWTLSIVPDASWTLGPCSCKDPCPVRWCSWWGGCISCPVSPLSVSFWACWSSWCSFRRTWLSACSPAPPAAPLLPNRAETSSAPQADSLSAAAGSPDRTRWCFPPQPPQWTEMEWRWRW